MCCIFSVLVFLGPRFGLIFWYLYQPGRFDKIFDGWLFPVLGWLVLPWTTLMWVAVGLGGVSGFDWLWIGLGVLAATSLLAVLAAWVWARPLPRWRFLTAGLVLVWLLPLNLIMVIVNYAGLSMID